MQIFALHAHSLHYSLTEISRNTVRVRAAAPSALRFPLFPIYLKRPRLQRVLKSVEWNAGDETTQREIQMWPLNSFSVEFGCPNTKFHKFLIFIVAANTFSWPHKNMLNRMFISSSVFRFPLPSALGGRTWAVSRELFPDENLARTAASCF